MKTLALLAALAPAASFAQWTIPNILSNLGGDQVQPKIKVCPDGSCYISWFDNSAVGYDVRLQRLDRDGVPQFPANGLLVADLNNSSTQDYDLAVDSAGNAYLAFQDTRGFTVTSASVMKISPAGAFVWGPNGVNISGGLAANQPKVCVLESGAIAAAYTGSNNFTLRRYSPLGVEIGTPVTVSETGRGMSLSDLEPSDGDNVIAMWVRGTGSNLVTSNKWLYAQRFALNGTGLWTGTGTGTWASGVPVIVFSANSIQTANFPTIIPDGNGGFVTAWYETGGTRNAYMQHIQVDGSRKFGSVNTAGAVSGLSIVDSTPGRMQISANIAYDRWSGDYLIASSEAQISPQSNYSNVVQKIDRNGNRLWPTSGPKNGVTVQPIGSQTSFVSTQFFGKGAVVTSMYYIGAFPKSVIVASLDENGNESYGVSSQVEIYGTGTDKARLTTERDLSGDLLAAWTDNSDLYAARYNHPNGVVQTFNGTITPGDYVGDPTAINWVIEISQGAQKESRLVNVDTNGDWEVRTSFTGPVTITIDGAHWIKRRFVNVVAGIGGITPQNGDADGSGEVDAADIDLVIANFGGLRYTTAYNLNADLDGSGEVDAADIDIAIANFGGVDE